MKIRSPLEKPILKLCRKASPVERFGTSKDLNWLSYSLKYDLHLVFQPAKLVLTNVAKFSADPMRYIQCAVQLDVCLRG